MDRLKQIPDLWVAFLLLLVLFVAFRIWPQDWIKTMITTDFGAIMMALTSRMKEPPDGQPTSTKPAP